MKNKITVVKISDYYYKAYLNGVEFHVTGYKPYKNQLMNTAIEINARETAKKIKEAFKKLRKAGFKARYGIISDSDAGQEWAEKVEGIYPYVFCERYGVEGMKKDNSICLYYSGLKTTTDEESTEAAGRVIVEYLKAEGLETEWNGKAFQAITAIGAVTKENTEIIDL